eukprot:TRINITY_DN8299_c0_g1_i2.p1 TRINITY_DN8299_c0_g1~~TRINITY_DN8299_c0_g1_i2.p1  ORF type:complete len:121 (+),score=32.82 TRINITY_DN8299_c0_g1_i2:54-416(+)
MSVASQTAPPLPRVATLKEVKHVILDVVAIFQSQEDLRRVSSISQLKQQIHAKQIHQAKVDQQSLVEAETVVRDLQDQVNKFEDPQTYALKIAAAHNQIREIEEDLRRMQAQKALVCNHT